MISYAIEVEKYVYAHLNEKITVKALSDNVYMSMYHFVREFKKETGVTPKKFIMQIKLNSAEHLLLKSDKKIHEIAASVGYEAGRFSNLFKEYTGTSPSDYRTEYQIISETT